MMTFEHSDDSYAEELRDRIEVLEKAFKWVLENRAIWSYGDFAFRHGNGELEGLKSPDDIYELVSSLMDRS